MVKPAGICTGKTILLIKPARRGFPPAQQNYTNHQIL